MAVSLCVFAKTCLAKGQGLTTKGRLYSVSSVFISGEVFPRRSTVLISQQLAQRCLVLRLSDLLSVLFAAGRWRRADCGAGHGFHRFGGGESFLLALLCHKQDLTTKVTKDHKEMRRLRVRVRLLRPPYPRVLPCHLKILVVPTKTDVSSPAVGKFQRLVLRDGKCKCAPKAGAAHAGTRVPDPV